VERIGRSAFGECSELVTVIVPLESASIDMESQSFYNCRKLANLVLPYNSNPPEEEDAFLGYDLLHERYGDESHPRTSWREVCKCVRYGYLASFRTG